MKTNSWHDCSYWINQLHSWRENQKFVKKLNSVLILFICLFSTLFAAAFENLLNCFINSLCHLILTKALSANSVACAGPTKHVEQVTKKFCMLLKNISLDLKADQKEISPRFCFQVSQITQCLSRTSVISADCNICFHPIFHIAKSSWFWIWGNDARCRPFDPHLEDAVHVMHFPIRSEWIFGQIEWMFQPPALVECLLHMKLLEWLWENCCNNSGKRTASLDKSPNQDIFPSEWKIPNHQDWLALVIVIGRVLECKSLNFFTSQQSDQGVSFVHLFCPTPFRKVFPQNFIVICCTTMSWNDWQLFCW